MQMQRTTIRIQKTIYQKAKKRAVEKGTSFQAVINAALKESLMAKRSKNQEPLVLRDKPLNLPQKISRQYIYKG